LTKLNTLDQLFKIKVNFDGIKQAIEKTKTNK